MKESQKVVFHRLFWILISLIILVIPLFLESGQPSLKIVSSDMEVSNYYENLHESVCSVKVEFNRDVKIGNITLAFFDESNSIIESGDYSFTRDSSDNILSNNFISVNGKVSRCEVVSHNIEAYDGDFFMIYALLVVTIPMIICALFVRYKEYKYNGNTISVYAGFFHHTLRVNGQIVDEHNTLITYSSIHLESAVKLNEKESLIEANISLMNSITVKVDKKLIRR